MHLLPTQFALRRPEGFSCGQMSSAGPRSAVPFGRPAASFQALPSALPSRLVRFNSCWSSKFTSQDKIVARWARKVLHVLLPFRDSACFVFRRGRASSQNSRRMLWHTSQSSAENSPEVTARVFSSDKLYGTRLTPYMPLLNAFIQNSGRQNKTSCSPFHEAPSFAVTVSSTKYWMENLFSIKS